MSPYRIAYYILQAIAAGFIIAGVIRHWNDAPTVELVPLQNIAY